jgi:membrane dipeptidase
MRRFPPCSLIALLAAACAQAQPQPKAAEPPEARAERLLTQTPLADGHNDWPWALRGAYGVDGAKSADLSVTAGGKGHTSIPLAKQGRLGIQLWSVYVPATLAPADAVAQTFEQIGIAKSFAARHPESFATVTTAKEALAAWKAGKVAGLLALEGAHQVDDDIATLNRAHAAGVRAMTLAHSRNTRLFDSATDTPRHNGMAAGGAAMIAEMNRLGILVDLSHVSPQVMHQVLDIARAPVIFSHSSAQAVTNHPRNVPDDVLKRLPKNRGLVMVTFVPAFVDQRRADWNAALDTEKKRLGVAKDADPALAPWKAANPRPVTTLGMVADHVDHVARVAGHDHVGIGGDFDGIPDTPQGLENAGTYPALFAELARRGWSDVNLTKLAGENFLRVLEATEAQARR